MAARRRKSAPSASSHSADPRQRLIAAALDLAAERGWRRIGIADIAEAAEVPLGETHAIFNSKFAVLRAFRHGIDTVVLAGPAPGESDSPRDRLFDVLMRRLEALKPHRPALRAIFRDSVGQPGMVWGACSFLHSMSWMLAAAGIPNAGCNGRIATKLVSGLYLSVLPTFYRDQSEDLGTTMAALDKRLRQAESLLSPLRPVAERFSKMRA
jgi:AcrR family transcriptional regulator